MKSYNDFKQQINEVLKANDPIEKWIDDFVHSKNPKFAGKTKAERIDMAKGAYYGAQKNEGYAASQNSTAVQDMEAVEYKGIGTDVVDKKKKLNPQPNLMTAKKTVKDFKESVLTSMAIKDLDKLNDYTAHVTFKDGRKQQIGLRAHNAKTAETKAYNQLKDVHHVKIKEEVQIDELSKGLVAKYANKVAKTTQANYDKSKDKFQFSSGRQDGMKNAVKRLTKEEAEQIDEISKKTLANYVNKAAHDAASGAYQGKEYTAQSNQHTAAGDWDTSKKKHDLATKEFDRANKRLVNIPKATTKLAKEGFLNRSEEDDMQTLSAAEFYKKYGKNKTSHRKGRGTKSSDVEKYTEQVKESRGHKILNTFFKNREIAQRAFNGQNKPEEKKPVYNEKGIETPKVKTEDAYPSDEKWTDFDPKKHATNSKNKKGEK